MLIIGFSLGYFIASSKNQNSLKHPVKKPLATHSNFHDKLHMKAHHQSDSDRIRELNRLDTNQSIFLRQLKQNFQEHEIAINN